VGTPEKVMEFKLVWPNVIPGGKVPEAIFQSYGAAPLVTSITALKVAPVVAAGSVTAGIEGSGTMYMLELATSVGFATPVAEIVALSPAVVSPLYVTEVVVMLLSDPGPTSDHVTP
jgi:hypothetical protein